MNKILLLMILALPFPVSADYMDVIEFQLKDGCSLSQYLEVVKDFNEQWGKKNAYTAEVAVPVTSDNLVRMFWLGTTNDAAGFGKAWDTWRKETSDPKSVAARLLARFAACEDNLSRRGYDIY